MPEWVRAELGHEPGREGRRGAPSLRPRNRQAGDQSRRSRGRGGAALTPLPGPATASFPGWASTEPGRGQRPPSARPLRPEDLTYHRRPRARRGGQRLPDRRTPGSSARQGQAPPRPAPPRGGPLTPRGLGWFGPGVTSAGARSRRDCAGRAAFRAAAAGRGARELPLVAGGRGQAQPSSTFLLAGIDQAPLSVLWNTFQN